MANPFPIDAYAYSNRLRWAHPAEKMVFALVTLSLCLFFRSWPVSAAVVAVMTMLLWQTAGVGPLVFWQFLRLPLGFILLGVLTIVVILVPPEAAATAWAVPLGNWHIGITPASATEGLRVLAVSLGSIASTLFLALTTPLADITDQLRRWRVPSLFIELMVIVYRFIFVLLETAESMYTAQQARLGYSTTRRALRSAAVLASNLYLRANARATALFTALTARGYNGDLRVLMDRPAWSVRRILAFTALDLLFVCVGLRSA